MKESLIKKSFKEKKTNFLRSICVIVSTLIVMLLYSAFRESGYQNLWDIFSEFPYSASSVIFSNNTVRHGPVPNYLNWDFNLSLEDEICLPGQDIKLKIFLTGMREDIKIIDKPPVVITESIGGSERKLDVEDIPIPQLNNKVINKGEIVELTINVKAPTKPGAYLVEFGEINLQGKGTLSGGGTKFTVLAPDSEVYIKKVVVNKEINAHGNIIKIYDIAMNNKEIVVNYSVNSPRNHALCSLTLKADTGETLYSVSSKAERDIISEMYGAQIYNQVPLAAKKTSFSNKRLN